MRAESPFPHHIAPDGSFAFEGPRPVLTGNRGILHDAQGRASTARWRHKAWISCTLKLRADRPKLQLTAPRHYTPLFFADEALALAAGHRPCAFCRREAWSEFQRAWVTATGLSPRAPEIDKALHRARLDRDRHPATHIADCASLPDHSFIRTTKAPGRLEGAAFLPLTPRGYAPALPRPEGPVTVLTPLPLLQVLRAGYHPALTRDQDRASWPDSRG